MPNNNNNNPLSVCSASGVHCLVSSPHPCTHEPEKDGSYKEREREYFKLSTPPGTIIVVGE